jgi:hypothetical protein
MPAWAPAGVTGHSPDRPNTFGGCSQHLRVPELGHAETVTRPSDRGNGVDTLAAGSQNRLVGGDTVRWLSARSVASPP